MNIFISQPSGTFRGALHPRANSSARKSGAPLNQPLILALAAAFAILTGCGSSSGSSSSSSSTTTSTATAVANSHGLVVNSGPLVNGAAVGKPNTLYTPVTICLPGTTTCQTIFNIQVSTGFSGLRILSSAFSLTLPQSNDANGNPIANCGRFPGGSYQWGPVGLADVTMEGEKASSVPVQVVGANFTAAPSSCKGTGTALDNITALGANGILGIGVFKQDCGTACTTVAGQNPPVYYSCPSGGCAPVAVTLSQQLQNPVWMFPQDNNGVVINLPSVGDIGTNEARGTLYFGIGTQADNGIGVPQTVLSANAQGRIFVTFNGINYPAYFDTGSSATVFPNTLGLPLCSKASLASYYCPASNLSLSAINTGTNATSSTAAFGVANALALSQVAFGQNVAFSNLAGINSNLFVWGLPFFYGRTVFVGIDGQTATTTATATVASTTLTGPFWAY